MHRLVPVVQRLFPDTVAAEALDFDVSVPRTEIALPAQLASSVPKRRAEFAAGRLCAQAALGRVGCAPAPEVGIGALRAPVWPRGYTGSITHVTGTAAAVAARLVDARSLGLDLERVVHADQASSLAPSVTRDEERALVSTRLADPSAAFTAVFAAKEALFKCVAPIVGCYFDFLDAEVTTIDDAGLSLRLRVELGHGFGVGRVVRVSFARLGEEVVAGVSLPPDGGADDDDR